MGFELVGGVLWEVIDNTSQRLKVPGGWVIRSYVKDWVQNSGVTSAMSMIFVADLNHEWTLP